MKKQRAKQFIQYEVTFTKDKFTETHYFDLLTGATRFAKKHGSKVVCPDKK